MSFGPKPIREQEVAWSEELTDLLLHLEGDKEAIASILRNNRHPRVERAEGVLRGLGYEDKGGEHWKPPIGRLKVFPTYFQNDDQTEFWKECVIALLRNGGAHPSHAPERADDMLVALRERQKPMYKNSRGPTRAG